MTEASAAGAVVATDGVAAKGIRMFTRETARTGRYGIIGAEPGNARRFWFVLHGYGGLAARFLRAFDGIMPEDTCVVAPEGLSRFYHDMPRADGAHLRRVGATWMTREARELDIADTLRWLDGVHEEVVASARRRHGHVVTGLLGFSQGVATAMRWAADGVIAPRTFVAWAGGLAVDVNGDGFAAKMANGSVVLVAGDRDEFVTPALRSSALEGLRRYDAAVREIVFPGEHTLDPQVLSTLLHELPSNV